MPLYLAAAGGLCGPGSSSWASLHGGAWQVLCQLWHGLSAAACLRWLQVSGNTDGITIRLAAQTITDMVLVHGEAHSAVARTIR